MQDAPGGRARGQPELHRVAEVVAGAHGPDEVFTAVAREASVLLGGHPTTLLRFEGEGSAVVVAVHGGPAPAGTVIRSHGETITLRVQRSGRPERIDDYSAVPGMEHARDFGLRAAVGVPVTVGGRLWGMITASSGTVPLPLDTEHQLSQFAELVAAAVSSAQARSALQEAADEQAALRRVAELVARGAAPQELFAAVALEAAGLIDEDTVLARMDDARSFTVVGAHGGLAPVGTRVEVPPDDKGVMAEILRTHRPARLDDYDGRRGHAYAYDDYGVTSSVGVPIIVDDALWGVLGATTRERPLPAGAEQRLAEFAGLVAAALANAQARAQLQQLADEQSALRAVAELVARTAPAQELFAAVATEASALLAGAPVTLTRFERDAALVVVAACGGPVPVGTRLEYVPATLPDRARRGRELVRVDDYARELDAALAERFGLAAAVAAPVVVSGEAWGLLTATSSSGPLPAATEQRLEQFTGLVAAALANAQARTELQQLAEEQAALRQVAELVARGAALGEIFEAVAAGASRLLGLSAALMRYEPDDVAVVVASHRSPALPGLRVPSTGDTALAVVRRSGGPVRVDDFALTTLADVARGLGVVAGVAVPVTVEGRLWGTLTASSSLAPLPAGTEERLAQLAELAAAAIANAENRAKLTASRARVVATADETRRRLQRDVHDTTQQRLVHTVINLRMARDAIAAGLSGADLVDEALRHAEHANRDLHDVVRGILPAALTLGGLPAGLESLVDDLGLPVHLTVDVPRLATPVETTAYFVVAEALANVVKHAGAGHAHVDVGIEGHQLVVAVRDDGRGGADPSRGSGLTGLLDRVEANEGTLALDSPPGGGTVLRVTLPLA